MTRKLLLLCLLVMAVIPGQAQTDDSQKEAERFILKVLSEYQNPMSYYPLRRDLFLPDEEELAKKEMEQNYPKGARSFGFIVFVKDDSEYEREPFIDADGDLLDLSLFGGRRDYPSLRSDGDLFRRKQRAYQNRYPSMGQFLYFNSNYHLIK